VAAGYAIEESVATMADDARRAIALVNDTIKGISERIPTMKVNGDSGSRLPGVLNMGFDGVSGESLMHLLDLKGICVSTSSACSSGSEAPSHVLLALGLTELQAQSAIRISYGKYNTTDEIGPLVNAVCDAYCKIKVG
jgi:cysteine desulfurase